MNHEPLAPVSPSKNPTATAIGSEATRRGGIGRRRHSRAVRGECPNRSAKVEGPALTCESKLHHAGVWWRDNHASKHEQSVATVAEKRNVLLADWRASRTLQTGTDSRPPDAV